MRINKRMLVLVPAVLVAAAGLDLGLPAQARGEVRLQGRYEYVVRPENRIPVFSATYNFEMVIGGCSWIISYEDLSAATNADLLNVRATASCDGTNIYLVQYQSDTAQKGAWGSRYDSVRAELPTAIAKIFPGNYPPPEEFTLQNIWFALAANCVLGSPSGRTKPIEAADLAIFYGDTNFWRGYFRTTDRDKPGTHFITLTNDGHYIIRDPGSGRVRRFKYRPPYDKGFVEGAGVWRGVTNVSGMFVPREFEYTGFHPKFGEHDSAVFEKTMSFRCVVTNVETGVVSEVPARLPSGRVLVADRRLADEGWARLDYVASNGWVSLADVSAMVRAQNCPKSSFESEVLYSLTAPPRATTDSSAALESGVAVGRPAPPLNLAKILQAPAGASADWTGVRGKVVVIDFWATWCAPCRRAIPHWNELVDTFQGKPVVFLAISDENEQVVSAFLKRTPIRGWVGLDGAGQSARDRYGIHGIPTTVVINQQGVVAAVTHPAQLQAKDIDEVIATGKSSLRSPAEDEPIAGETSSERVAGTGPGFEVSARRSGPVPPGHGTECWAISAASADVSGQYASVRRAILTCFGGKPALLELHTTLPTEQYDFTVKLPPGASHADREQAVAPLFRSVFGLEVRRIQAEREVYVLTVASTNAPGLVPSGPRSTGSGSAGAGRLNLSRVTLDSLADSLEGVLHQAVLNEAGLTNRYDIRLRWKMSKRELLAHTMDREVLAFAEGPDSVEEAKLSADQQGKLAAFRGKLPQAELETIPAEDREDLEVLRAELAKPEDERFQPEPESIRAAVREQLGLELSLQRRSMPVLIVEKAAVHH